MARNNARNLIAIGIKERASGERGDELLCVNMLRGAENLCWRSTFENLACMQNCDAMTKRRNRQQIMRDVKDSHPKLTAELGKQAENFRLGDGIQSEEHTSELQSRFDLVCLVVEMGGVDENY